MLKLDKLESISQKRKRIGRGGERGGQSGRGHKGQRARSGGTTQFRSFFEGGQMPLARRIPKRGFTNFSRETYQIVNLQDLELRFSDGDTVDRNSLMEKALIRGKKISPIKILGKGTLTKKLTVMVDAYSKSAIQAIEKAKGKVLLIEVSEEKTSGSVAS
ncbi:MAG: 50S ribosomal protein L15 [bacterium]